MTIAFTAWEYRGDGGFAAADYRFERDGEGWRILRNGDCLQRLPDGYRPVRTLACGVCATDLARRQLPFPLPQVTGHEVVALDEEDRRVVVDINASHTRRGRVGACPWCRAGLDSQCPARLTLGIDRLPGGFGPWMLVPEAGLIQVPAAVGTAAASFAEPLAAARHALRISPPRPGESVAVLGPRRLGMLLVAALEAFRRDGGPAFTIQALSRHPHLLDLARALGADGGSDPDQPAIPTALPAPSRWPIAPCTSNPPTARSPWACSI